VSKLPFEVRFLLFAVWTVIAMLVGAGVADWQVKKALVERGHACWTVNPTNGATRLVFRGEEGFVR